MGAPTMDIFYLGLFMVLADWLAIAGSFFYPFQFTLYKVLNWDKSKLLHSLLLIVAAPGAERPKTAYRIRALPIAR